MATNVTVFFFVVFFQKLNSSIRTTKSQKEKEKNWNGLLDNITDSQHIVMCAHRKGLQYLNDFNKLLQKRKVKVLGQRTENTLGFRLLLTSH